MTYDNIKRLILKGSLSDEQKSDLLNKMDMFCLFNRLTDEEYRELYTLMYPNIEITDDELQENDETQDSSNGTNESVEPLEPTE